MFGGVIIVGFKKLVFRRCGCPIKGALCLHKGADWVICNGEPLT